jgi:hypothetical protein
MENINKIMIKRGYRLIRNFEKQIDNTIYTGRVEKKLHFMINVL